MNNTPPSSPPYSEAFSEADVRDFAYHLYTASGSRPNQDRENWYEAEACLGANIPQHKSHQRLHHHLAANVQQPVPSPRPAAAASPKTTKAQTR